MTVEAWDAHVAQYGNASDQRSPYGRFMVQRKSARHDRHISWELTFAQWWAIWQESGKWEQRGRGHGYAMARWGDSDGYKVGNVYICTVAQNSADSYLTKPATERTRKMLKTKRERGLIK